MCPENKDTEIPTQLKLVIMLMILRKMKLGIFWIDLKMLLGGPGGKLCRTSLAKHKIDTDNSLLDDPS